MPDTDAQLLTQLFLSLRGRAGLTADRLREHDRGVAAVLTSLTGVRARVSESLDEFESAALVVRETAMNLATTSLLVVDAALSLGAVEALAVDRSLEMVVPATLYANNIGDRRQTLVRAWVQLHRLVDEDLRPSDSSSEVPPAPTVGGLRARNGYEAQAFAELAAELLAVARTKQPTSELRRADLGHEAGQIQPMEVNGRPVQAVIVGAAVMDALFVIDQMPPEDQSRQAQDQYHHPGGKGLVQSVAAVRLGMHARLVTALGMDPFGPAILDYLDKRDVDCDFVDPRPGHRSPVTAVIVLDEADGASMALGWRGKCAIEPDVFAQPRYQQLLRDADVLFVTFEPPVEFVEGALNACAALGDDKPLVVLSPAPPYDGTLLSGRALGMVDVVVANQWEAERLLARRGSLDLKEIVRRLLACNVEALCLFDRRGDCTVHQQNEPVITQAPMTGAQRGTAGARDAFCAALAYQMLSQDGEIDEDKVRFAMAAWSASIREVAVPESMPFLSDIYMMPGVGRRP